MRAPHWTIAAWLASAAAVGSACPLTMTDGQALEGDALQLAWKLVDRPSIPVSEVFAIEVRTCPVGAELLAVDAIMPAHRHGMNYKPSIKTIAPGLWQVDGLLWHMSGRWELRFDVRFAGRIRTVRQTIELP